MLPPDRGGVGQEMVGRRLAGGAQVVHGVGEIGRVPPDDGGDDQVEARRPQLLGFMGPAAMRPCRKVQMAPVSAWRCSLLLRPA